MIVIKFGGSSVGSVENIHRVKDIVKQKEQPVIVVVSAFSGVTNQLQSLGELALKNEYEPVLEQLRDRHIEAVKALIRPDRQTNVLVFIQQKIMELQSVCDSIFTVSELSDRVKARLLGQGELLSSQIIY